MKGKKLLSILLSLLMVITLMPMDSVEVHASDRKLCLHCDEWFDSGDYCEDCASDHFCICDDCHCFFHCGFCDRCYLTCDAEPCDENCFNAICVDCAEQEGYHCPDCHECYTGDEDQLCGNCFRCPECCDICENCGWCYECQPHCPECDSCDYEDEKCENDGEHCKECCIVCPECDECMFAKDQQPCEFCELCPECCEYNSCEYCGMCAEHPDYEDHLCAECGTCFETTDRCETCGLCVDCCLNEAAALGCECGEYCHEEVSDDHICDNCGECFGIVEQSSEAEDNGYCLCKDCYEEYLDIIGDGNHEITPASTWNMNSEYHWKECKYCDDDEHITRKSQHKYNERGVCSVCGYKDGSSVYITKQPKSRSVDISSKDTKDEDKDKAYFNVVAYSNSDLSYEWQYRVVGTATTWKAFAKGEAEGFDTASLIYTARPGDCHSLDGSNHNRLTIRCKISGNGYTSYTDGVTLTVNHKFDPKEQMIVDKDGHSFKCNDEDCNVYGKKEKHKYTNWQWNADRTEKTATCEVCGYEKTYHTHKHEITNFYSHMNNMTLTNEDTDEWTGEDEGYEYIIDERHHEGLCDVEGIGECGVYINEAHKWGPWQLIHTAPTKENERGGLHRICKVCEYDADKVQNDENGKPLYWEFGVHPVNIIDGTTDYTRGLLREGTSINLIPDKKEDKVFYGWKLEYQKLNKFTDESRNNYVTITVSVYAGQNNDEFGLSSDLKTLTIPEFNDAGVWTLTALYRDGCKHTKTEVSGELEATCGHMGYTGDTVCSDCGKVMEKGEDIDKLEHEHVHMVEETKVRKDYKGNVVRNENGELVYVYRTHELGDCVNHVKSYSGDYICDDCGQIVERGHYGAPEHDWKVLKEGTHIKATTRRKGKDYCECKNCGTRKDVISDYTGPDYTVIPSRKNITFNYEYGKDYKPVVIDFKRTGRNADEIEKIVALDYSCSGETLDVKITGDMQISITPKAVNYFFYDPGETIDVEFITKSGKKVWLSSLAYSEPDYGGEYDENYDYTIKITTNVRLSKETYTLTVINGNIYDYTEKNNYGSTKVFHAGEGVFISALNDELKEKFGKDSFIEWEVVSDKSGIYKEHFKKYGSSNGYDWMSMPNNDVVLRAVFKHTHEYEFDKTVAPTATEKGYDLYKCKYCSEELKKNEKAALGNVKGDSKTVNKDNNKKVNLKKVKLHKLKAKKKGIKVSWKKVSGASGYQIQYSLNKKFKKGKKYKTKSVLVKKGKTTKKVLKKLKSKKTYYVRVRAYVVVNGVKKFSAWSKKKKVKVK